VVQDAEELSPETKPNRLGEAKLPLQPNIGLDGVETAQHITSEIALLPCGRCRKSRPVENFAAGISSPIESGTEIELTIPASLAYAKPSLASRSMSSEQGI
jgi:hypothetical protein